MDLNGLQFKIESNISRLIEKYCPTHEFSEVYRYALLPAGKLFRPKLAWACALDQTQELDKQQVSDLELFSCSIEIHHVYTLLHDDLPCMDDDDYRRGKLSTHKKFSEWQSLLAGDGLLNLSYQLIFQLQSPLTPIFGRYMARALGPKGLIHGQTMDLLRQSNLSLKNLVETHRLKTARLIQVALVGGYILGQKQGDHSLEDAKRYHRLGESLGLAFQFLDDLTELDEELGEHESSINPWCQGDLKAVSKQLTLALDQIQKNLGRNNNLRRVCREYFSKIENKIDRQKTIATIKKHQEKIEQDQIKELLAPVMSLLERLGEV